MTPARYMLGGRTGTCFLIVDDKRLIPNHGNSYISKDFYGNIGEKKSNLIITAFSIVLFIPSLIIGAAFKTPALLCSERLRRRYNTFKNLKTPQDKAYHELRIGIGLKNEKHIDNYSKYVKEMANPDTFFNALQDGNNIYTGYMYQSILAKQLSRLNNKEISSQDYLKEFFVLSY